MIWRRNQDDALELRLSTGDLVGGAWKNASGWHPCSWLDDGFWGWVSPPVALKQDAMRIVEEWVGR